MQEKAGEELTIAGVSGIIIQLFPGNRAKRRDGEPAGLPAGGKTGEEYG